MSRRGRKKTRKAKGGDSLLVRISDRVAAAFTRDELISHLSQHDLTSRRWVPLSVIRRGEEEHVETIIHDWGEGSEPIFGLLYHDDTVGVRENVVHLFFLSEAGQSGLARNVRNVVDMGRNGIPLGHHRCRRPEGSP